MASSPSNMNERHNNYPRIDEANLLNAEECAGEILSAFSRTEKFKTS